MRPNAFNSFDSKSPNLAQIGDETVTTQPDFIQGPQVSATVPSPRFSPDDANEARARFSFELGLLARLGIGKPLLEKALRAASQNGTELECELLATGLISEEAYYETIAQLLNVPYLSEIPATAVTDSDVLDTQLTEPSMVRVNRSNTAPIIALSPQLKALPAILERCQASASFKQAIAIASPATIRAAVWQAGAKRRLSTACNMLFDKAPQFSARFTLSGVQGFIAGLAIGGFSAVLFYAPAITLQVMHVALAVLYMSSLALRAGAVWQRRTASCHTKGEGPLPVYSILIALYREEQIVPQLVSAMKKLDWPASRLDIKLVCEADDTATLNAVRKHATARQFEIVEVPPSLPRTKPKALNYALSGTRGAFIALYDAEDRPHPGQLKEAYERFCGEDEKLACLQAPLVVSNGGNSWISALFALEYSALFRGMLPMLARFRLPLPLGGTSNHFRADALLAAGGWDPYNVTEDADLGIRLSRLGWRCGMLSRPTLEDAPEDYRVWRHQRSRWFKGWMQTLLVHMRNPAALARQIGILPLLAVLGMTGGMVFSALAHPILLISAASGFALTILTDRGLSGWQTALLSMDCFNLAGSYIIVAALGRLHMTGRERRSVGPRLLAIPLYWMMISLAAWRSLFELWTKPHHWRKTPHKPSRQRSEAKPCP